MGLVGGWLLRPMALRVGFVEPRVGWGTIGLLLFLAASVAATAWVTRRTVRRDRAALPHHTAVNRLALGKACSLVGAVLTGATPATPSPSSASPTRRRPVGCCTPAPPRSPRRW